MKIKYILFFCSLLFIFALNAEDVSKSQLKAESNFYQVKEINYSFKKGKITKDYKSNKTRIWYSFFPAKKNASKKPLFVMVNGGPGCATTTNLFVNTAPYVLNKEIIGDKYYKKNKYSWTQIGNILYIDAPNTGFSYMLSDCLTQAGTALEFVSGANFNSFIDADQVLRTVLHVVNKYKDLRKNKIIFVGESYSGVRVSTILNLVLFYSQYEKGKKVFKDKELCRLIENYLKKALGVKAKKPYSPEAISKIFNKQILIQPQIVDSYQSEDAAVEFKKSNSIMERLEKQTHSKETWKSFLKRCKGDANTASLLFLNFINRDQYNCMKPSTWSDDIELHAFLALKNIDILSKITGTKIETIDYMLPAHREKASRYMFNKKNLDFLKDPTIKTILDLISPAIRIFLELAPNSTMFPPDVEQNGRTLNQVLGGLSEYDNYLIGTNAYIFIGFMANAGLEYNFEDIFGISPESSTIYGRMFLENLSVVETFMTDAKYDLVVYSSTLPSQFDNRKGRFTDIVSDIQVSNGNLNKDGYFTIYYKKNSVKGLTRTPKFRTVKWPHYEISGHSVSTTQPDKFLKDVNKFINNK